MREIDAETFLETMRQNTHFNLVDTPLGVCVEMEWVDAFASLIAQIRPTLTVKFIRFLQVEVCYKFQTWL